MTTGLRRPGAPGTPAGLLGVRAVGRHLARHAVAVVGLLVIVALVAVWLRAGGQPGATAPPATPQPPVTNGRPAAGDLTLARPAGQVLVGLTVRPAQPGPNDLLIYLIPIEGEEAAGPLEVTLTVAGQPVSPERCGAPCRRATAELRGGETVQVTVEGPSGSVTGGTAAFPLPSLPVADGQALFDQAQQRMHQLDTVAIVERFSIDETFPAAGDPTEANYAFRAPDRMRVVTGAGAETVIVGTTRYRRNAPDAPWESERGLQPLQAPGYTWDAFLPPVAPSIVGTERVDGQPTTIVAFAGRGDNIPVWFRLWVDADGLVRRATMHAQAHFMHHRYHSFNAPITITPPASPSQGN